MSQDRRMLVLRAVVEEYIRTHEPVGSGAVTKNFPLHVSSATVRNDMAALEEEGYLVQPHTSAGRVPTEKGYRFFVDRLIKVVPLSTAQQRGIEAFFTQSVSLEDTLRSAARLLAQITGQVAVVASPSIVKSHLRRFEMVPLASNTYLVVIISDTGRVEQRTVATSIPLRSSDINRLIQVVNTHSEGVSIASLSRRLRDIAESDDFSSMRAFIDVVADSVCGIRDEERNDSLYMSGASQLTRHGAAALSTLAPLLDALEEQVVLMRLMGSLSRSADAIGVNGVGVAIGSETHTQGLLNASVVTSGYGSTTAKSESDRRTPNSEADAGGQPSEISEGTTPLAFVGSIGPTHMNYPTTISAVKAVAEYLSAFINRQDS